MPSHYLPIRRTRGFRGDLTASPDPLRSLVLRSVPLLYHHSPAVASTILGKTHFFHHRILISKIPLRYCLTLRYPTTSAPYGQKLHFCPIRLRSLGGFDASVPPYLSALRAKAALLSNRPSRRNTSLLPTQRVLASHIVN